MLECRGLYIFFPGLACCFAWKRVYLITSACLALHFFLCWCNTWTPLLSSSAGAYGRWPMSQPGHALISGVHMVDYITVQKVCWASLSFAGSTSGGSGALTTTKWFAGVFGLSGLLPADSPGPAGLCVSACCGGKDLITLRKTRAACGC